MRKRFRDYDFDEQGGMILFGAFVVLACIMLVCMMVVAVHSFYH